MREVDPGPKNIKRDISMEIMGGVGGWGVIFCDLTHSGYFGLHIFFYKQVSASFILTHSRTLLTIVTFPFSLFFVALEHSIIMAEGFFY